MKEYDEIDLVLIERLRSMELPKPGAEVRERCLRRLLAEVNGPGQPPSVIASLEERRALERERHQERHPATRQPTRRPRRLSRPEPPRRFAASLEPRWWSDRMAGGAAV